MTDFVFVDMKSLKNNVNVDKLINSNISFDIVNTILIRLLYHDIYILINRQSSRDHLIKAHASNNKRIFDLFRINRFFFLSKH